MKAGTTPGRAGSLVIELASRTATVDGRRVELPPTEFSLLAVLAARPGQVVSHKELLIEAFGDSAYMDASDLYYRIWSIRRLIGDSERTLVRNRRGQGFLLDLRPKKVKIIEGVASEDDVEPTPAIRPEHAAQGSQAGAEDGASEAVDETVVAATEPATAVLAVTRARIRPVTVVAALLVAGLALGGSWVAGYRLSQRVAPAAGDTGATETDRGGDITDPDRPDRPQKASPTTTAERGSKGGGERKGDVAASGAGGGGGTSATSPDAPATSGDSGGAKKSGGGKTAQKPSPPPPQPDAQLYHLFNPDSADHFMTTSSSAANQKQAAGYSVSVEGRVFTKQVPGTVAITLDGGTAYIYRDRDDAPEGVSVTELYQLTNSGDSFHTKSSSAANQAEAQGWSRSLAGFVQ